MGGFSSCFLTPMQSLGLPSAPRYRMTWHPYCSLSSSVPPVQDFFADPLPLLCPTMVGGFSQTQTSTQLSCSQISHWESEWLFPSLDVGSSFPVALFQSPAPQEHVQSGPLLSGQGSQNPHGLWFSSPCFAFSKAGRRPQTTIRHTDWMIYLVTSRYFLVPLECGSLGYSSSTPEIFCVSSLDLSPDRVLPHHPSEHCRCPGFLPRNHSAEVSGVQETWVGTLESGPQCLGTCMAIWYHRKGFERIFPDVMAVPSGIPLLFCIRVLYLLTDTGVWAFSYLIQLWMWSRR